MIAWHDFAEAARQLVGCTVRHAGRQPETGLDCVGVPYAAARAAGLELKSTPMYGCQPTEEALIAGLSLFCTEADNPATAHIWQVPFLGGARHVVVPLEDVENGTLCVHAWSRRNRVLQTVWRRESVRGWHIKGVAWRQA